MRLHTIAEYSNDNSLALSIANEAYPKAGWRGNTKEWKGKLKMNLFSKRAPAASGRAKYFGIVGPQERLAG